MISAATLDALMGLKLVVWAGFLFFVFRKNLHRISELGASYMVVGFLASVGIAITQTQQEPKLGRFILATSYCLGLLIILVILYLARVSLLEVIASWLVLALALSWTRPQEPFVTVSIIGTVCVIYAVYLRKTWRVFIYKNKDFLHALFMMRALYVIILASFLQMWLTWLFGRLLGSIAMDSLSTVIGIFVTTYLLIRTAMLPPFRAEEVAREHRGREIWSLEALKAH